MPQTVIDLGGWQFWAVVLTGVLIVMWLIWGGQRNMEVVGLSPLAPPVDLRPVTPRTASLDGLFSLPEITPIVAPLRPARTSPTAQPSGNLVTGVTISPVAVHGDGLHTEVEMARRTRSIGEQLACMAFEELLGRRVEINTRPSFLAVEPRRRLQYDCYDPVAKIAVEYDGRQHRERVEQFQTDATYNRQVENDQHKDRLSREAGVRLIRISDLIDTHDPDPSAPNGYRLNRRLTREDRYNRIKNYLRHELHRM